MKHRKDSYVHLEHYQTQNKILMFTKSTTKHGTKSYVYLEQYKTQNKGGHKFYMAEASFLFIIYNWFGCF